MGNIHPIVGANQTPPTTDTSLADAPLPRVRQRVLAVLFGTPERSLYANEVIALAQSGTGAVQRELAGLLTVRKQGDNAFVTRVLQQPRIWRIGEETALAHGDSRTTA